MDYLIVWLLISIIVASIFYSTIGTGVIKSASQKGKAFERKVAKLFNEALPGIGAKRGLQYRDGSEAPDVDADPFWVETKKGKRPSVRGALKQVLADTPEGRVAMAIIGDDYEKPFAVMDLEDLLDILSEWWELKNVG